MMADETPEVRPRRAGKTAQKYATLTGLTPDTCAELLRAGWVLEFDHDAPTRWVQGGKRDDAIDALARGGMLPRGTVTMVGDGGGCVVPGGPGFSPGPAAGGAIASIQIHDVGDPNAVARQVSDELTASIRRLRSHQRDLS